jgi:hypothetical protein
MKLVVDDVTQNITFPECTKEQLRDIALGNFMHLSVFDSALRTSMFMDKDGEYVHFEIANMWSKTIDKYIIEKDIVCKAMWDAVSEMDAKILTLSENEYSSLCSAVDAEIVKQNIEESPVLPRGYHIKKAK